MTRVQLREENSPSTYRGPGGPWRPGDVADVPDEVAERLLRKPYFELAPDADRPDTDDSELDGVEETDPSDSNPTLEAEESPSTDDEDGSEGSSSDADSDFDADEWLEADFRDRADLVLEGRADDYLDPIEEVETSTTVTDAVEERRAELEEGG